MKKRFLLFLICFYASKLFALDTLTLGRDLYKEYTIGGEQLEILEDKTKKLTIEDILSDSNRKKFKLNKEAYAYNFNYISAYWVKFAIKNLSGTDRNFVLESYSPNTETIQLYYLDKTGNIQRKETGEIIKAFSQEHKHKNLVLDLPVADSGQTRVFYIRVFARHHSGFDYRIKSIYNFTTYSTNEYYVLGFYYGILAIMCLYNLIIFFTLKARIHLYYVLYIMSGILSTLTEDKLGYYYIWSDFPAMNNILGYHIAPLMFLITFVLYSVNFLELQDNYPKYFKIALGITLLYIVLYAVSMLLIPINLNILRFFYVIPFFFIYIVSWYTLVKGYKAARLFILGGSILLASIIMIQLRADHFIGANLFTVYFLNYSLVAESVVLSFALSDRIKIIRKQKDEAQQKVLEELQENKKLQTIVYEQLQEKQVLQEKVNKELEMKVSERTEQLKGKSDELEVANKKLQDIIDQTNKMNIKLDLDNWELKKDMQHAMVQRITGEEVSFETFQNIFRDEFTCYKFLHEMKWEHGFKCRKCGNREFKEMDKNFTKMCKKCRHPESVTSHTILHGLKFPINKSLYVIYLIHKRNGNVKLEEISDITGTSIAACSKFRAKIIEQMQRIRQKKEFVNWEEIILDVV